METKRSEKFSMLVCMGVILIATEYSVILAVVVTLYLVSDEWVTSGWTEKNKTLYRELVLLFQSVLASIAWVGLLFPHPGRETKDMIEALCVIIMTAGAGLNLLVGILYRKRSIQQEELS
jgi:hypothetical protein